MSFQKVIADPQAHKDEALQLATFIAFKQQTYVAMTRKYVPEHMVKTITALNIVNNLFSSGTLGSVTGSEVQQVQAQVTVIKGLLQEVYVEPQLILHLIAMVYDDIKALNEKYPEVQSELSKAFAQHKVSCNDLDMAGKNRINTRRLEYSFSTLYKTELVQQRSEYKQKAREIERSLRYFQRKMEKFRTVISIPAPVEAQIKQSTKALESLLPIIKDASICDTSLAAQEAKYLLQQYIQNKLIALKPGAPLTLVYDRCVTMSRQQGRLHKTIEHHMSLLGDMDTHLDAVVEAVARLQDIQKRFRRRQLGIAENMTFRGVFKRIVPNKESVEVIGANVLAETLYNYFVAYFKLMDRAHGKPHDQKYEDILKLLRVPARIIAQDFEHFDTIGAINWIIGVLLSGRQRQEIATWISRYCSYLANIPSAQIVTPISTVAGDGMDQGRRDRRYQDIPELQESAGN